MVDGTKSQVVLKPLNLLIIKYHEPRLILILWIASIQFPLPLQRPAPCRASPRSLKKQIPSTYPTPGRNFIHFRIALR